MQMRTRMRGITLIELMIVVVVVSYPRRNCLPELPGVLGTRQA